MSRSEIDPIAYYNPEQYVFPKLARHFGDAVQLDPAALYLILDWKAPRARTRHLARLAKKAGSFEAATAKIVADLAAAAAPEQRLKVLLTEWGFRLPTASAILTVLWPDTFTMYDIRVCDAVRGFHQLADRNWSPELWGEYQHFTAAVREAAPAGLSLRDCDRWLWGKNKQARMVAEVRAAAEVARPAEAEFL